MVSVSHHAVEHGVRASVGALRQCGVPCLVVQRVLHAALLQVACALNAAGSNEFLCLFVVGQVAGSGSHSGEVGLLDGESLHHLSAVVACTYDGCRSGAGVQVILIADAVVRVLSHIGRAVLQCYCGRLCLSVVGYCLYVGYCDVGVCKLLAVVHRNLYVGAFHHECVGVLVALHRGQLKVLQQVYVGSTARCLCYSCVPQSFYGAGAPVRIRCYFYGYCSAFSGCGHGVAADLEDNGAVLVGADSQLVAGYGARGHCHEGQY